MTEQTNTITVSPPKPDEIRLVCERCCKEQLYEPDYFSCPCEVCSRDFCYECAQLCEEDPEDFCPECRADEDEKPKKTLEEFQEIYEEFEHWFKNLDGKDKEFVESNWGKLASEAVDYLDQKVRFRHTHSTSLSLQRLPTHASEPLHSG